MSTLDNRYEAVVPDTLDLAQRAGGDGGEARGKDLWPGIHLSAEGEHLGRYLAAPGHPGLGQHGVGRWGAVRGQQGVSPVPAGLLQGGQGASEDGGALCGTAADLRMQSHV